MHCFISNLYKDKNFCNKINEYGIECGYVNPDGKGNIEYMAESHNQCREKAIEIGAEFLLHWEVDIFTHYRSIVELLLLRKKAVVSGVYHIRHGVDSHLCLTVRHQKHPLELATAFNLTDGADLMFVDGNAKQVANAGLGLSMIHKSVFEKMKFRADRYERAHPDSTFAEDLHYAKIPVFADTSLLMEHRNSKWLHL